jgi:hypothetical protein
MSQNIRAIRNRIKERYDLPRSTRDEDPPSFSSRTFFLGQVISLRTATSRKT